MINDQWWERATPSTWDAWAVADDTHAMRCAESDEREQWAAHEQEQREHEYQAWAQAQECVDASAHCIALRRRSLGVAALVPAAWVSP
jgi:hypothetical protein